MTQLSAPVIPERAPGAVFEILTPMPERPPQHAQMLPQGIEMRFAGRRDHWMTMQNNQFLSALSRLLLEPFAEFDFLRGVKLLAESAKLAERFCFAENKRTGRPSFHPADRVPDGREEFRPADRVVHFDHCPSAEVLAALDRSRQVREQLSAWIGVGVNEHEPVALGRRR